MVSNRLPDETFELRAKRQRGPKIDKVSRLGSLHDALYLVLHVATQGNPAKCRHQRSRDQLPGFRVLIAGAYFYGDALPRVERQNPSKPGPELVGRLQELKAFAAGAVELREYRTNVDHRPPRVEVQVERTPVM